MPPKITSKAVQSPRPSQKLIPLPSSCIIHKQPLSLICLHTTCVTSYKLLCIKCKKQKHFQHPNRVFQLKTFFNMLEANNLQFIQNSMGFLLLSISNKINSINRFRLFILEKQAELMDHAQNIHQIINNMLNQKTTLKKLINNVQLQLKQQKNLQQVSKSLSQLKPQLFFNVMHGTLKIKNQKCLKQKQILHQVCKSSALILSDIRSYLMKIVQVLLSQQTPQSDYQFEEEQDLDPKIFNINVRKPSSMEINQKQTKYTIDFLEKIYQNMLQDINYQHIQDNVKKLEDQIIFKTNIVNNIRMRSQSNDIKRTKQQHNLHESQQFNHPQQFILQDNIKDQITIKQNQQDLLVKNKQKQPLVQIYQQKQINDIQSNIKQISLISSIIKQENLISSPTKQKKIGQKKQSPVKLNSSVNIKSPKNYKNIAIIDQRGLISPKSPASNQKSNNFITKNKSIKKQQISKKLIKVQEIEQKIVQKNNSQKIQIKQQLILQVKSQVKRTKQQEKPQRIIQKIEQKIILLAQHQFIVKKLNDQIESLNQQLQTLKSLAVKYKQFTLQKDLLSNQIQQKLRQISQLEKSLLQNTLCFEQNILQKQGQYTQLLKQQSQTYENKRFVQIQQIKHFYQAKISQLSTEFQRMQNQSKQKYQTTISQMQSQKIKIQFEARKLQFQLTKMQLQTKNMQFQMDNMKLKIKNIEFQLNDKKIEIKNMQSEMNNMKIEIKNNQSQIKSLQSQVKDKQYQITDLHQKQENLQQKLGDLQQESINVYQKLTGLQDQLRKSHQIQSGLKKVVCLKQKQMQQLNFQTKRLLNKQTQSTRQISKLSLQLKLLQQKQNQTLLQFTQLKSDYSHTQSLLKDKNNHIQKLQNQLKQSNEINQLNIAACEVKSLKSIQEMEEIVQIRQGQKIWLRDQQIMRLQQNNHQLKLQLKQMHKQNTHLTIQVQNLTKRLNQVNKPQTNTNKTQNKVFKVQTKANKVQNMANKVQSQANKVQTKANNVQNKANNVQNKASKVQNFSNNTQISLILSQTQSYLSITQSRLKQSLHKIQKLSSVIKNQKQHEIQSEKFKNQLLNNYQQLKKMYQEQKDIVQGSKAVDLRKFIPLIKYKELKQWYQIAMRKVQQTKQNNANLQLLINNKQNQIIKLKQKQINILTKNYKLPQSIHISEFSINRAQKDIWGQSNQTIQRHQSISSQSIQNSQLNPFHSNQLVQVHKILQIITSDFQLLQQKVKQSSIIEKVYLKQLDRKRTENRKLKQLLQEYQQKDTKDNGRRTDRDTNRKLQYQDNAQPRKTHNVVTIKQDKHFQDQSISTIIFNTKYSNINQ